MKSLTSPPPPPPPPPFKISFRRPCNASSTLQVISSCAKNVGQAFCVFIATCKEAASPLARLISLPLLQHTAPVTFIALKDSSRAPKATLQAQLFVFFAASCGACLLILRCHSQSQIRSTSYRPCPFVRRRFSEALDVSL